MTEVKPMALQKRTPETMLAAQRRARVVELRLDGHPLREIAEEVGISIGRCSQILRRELETINAENRERTETHRNLELARLDAMQHALWARAVPEGDAEPSFRAATLIVRIMERRARLLGLDAPARTDATLHDAPSITFNFDLDALNADNLRGLLEEAEQREAAGIEAAGPSDA
jgi:hypothetical protein